MARSSSAAAAAPAGAVHLPRSTLGLLVVSARPEQWTKNLVVLAGVLFGGRLLDPRALGLALGAFGAFCALSSSVYLINDVCDRAADRAHVLKQMRPIAAGQLSPLVATAGGVVLAIVGLAGALAIAPRLAVVAAAYLVLLFLYSTVLKHVVILDVLTIAAGFVLRAAAGAVAVSVPISQWLVVCTTLLALFLALSKRRHELVLLGEGATGHRRILDQYSPYLLDQMIAVVTASTLIGYSLYAISIETAAHAGTDKLGLTIPFVLYGIFRYLYLVHQKRGGGNPSTLLLRDGPLLACVALWTVCVALLLYSPLGR